MTVPAGGEIAVYNSAVKTQDYRLVLGLDYPVWSADKTESFSAALDPEDWWFTQLAGGPVVSGGSVNFQLYGGALREMIITRPHWIPSDPTLAFQIQFSVTFPTSDPVYSPVIVVGALDDDFGPDGEPLKIVQLGTVTSPNELGQIRHSHNNTFDNPIANDLAEHDYVVQWDPDGANPLVVTRDGGTIHSGSGSKPAYVAFGFIWPTQDLTDFPGVDLGTPGSPKVVMSVSSFAVLELGGEGHETRTYPGWTTTDLGNDIDTAAEGERFAADGETWAIVPHSNIGSIRGRRGRSLSVPFDTLDVTLPGPDPDDPDTSPAIFAGDRLVGRHILLDTRITDETPTTTSWKRQFVGMVEKAEWAGNELSLDCRDRPMTRLDTFLSRGYTDLAPVAEVQAGELEGVRSALVVDQILDDLIDVADSVAGGVLGTVETQIRSLPHRPQSIGTGGQSLMPLFIEWCDRLALECWRKYGTSGVTQYGQVLVNLWTSSGTAGYTFRGKGASGGNVNLIAPFELVEDRKGGPGQVFYRNDSPVVGENLFNVEHLPILGVYPAAPFPPDGRVLNDSFGMLSDFGLSTLLPYRDAANNVVAGGVGRHRFKMESSRFRVGKVVVEGHDWMEPTDIVAVDDPDWTGVTSSEDWVIDNISFTIRDGQMRSTAELLPVDNIAAINRVT